MANEQQKPETRARTVVPQGSEGIPKKSSMFRKLTRIFLTDDPETALRNMVTNVAIPTFKKGIVDAFSMVVLGRPAFGNNPLSTITNWFTSPTPTQSNVPYWQFGGSTMPPQNSIVVETAPTFRDTLWFRDAAVVKAVMDEIYRVFNDGDCHRLRLMDLYDAAGYKNYDWQTAQYWGWTDLSGVQVYPENGGYSLKMPPIKNIR